MNVKHVLLMAVLVVGIFVPAMAQAMKKPVYVMGVSCHQKDCMIESPTDEVGVNGVNFYEVLPPRPEPMKRPVVIVGNPFKKFTGR